MNILRIFSIKLNKWIQKTTDAIRTAAKAEYRTEKKWPDAPLKEYNSVQFKYYGERLETYCKRND